MSESNITLNGFLCGSPYIGPQVIQLGHIFTRTFQGLPISDISEKPDTERDPTSPVMKTERL